MPVAHRRSGLLAWIAACKYLDHLPLYRIEQIAARQGVPLARSTLAEWIGRIGVALQPLADRLAELLRQQACLHADETPVRQLDPGSGKTKHAYLWAYRSGVHDAGPPIVVFDYQTSRAGAHARAFLQGWRGHLMVDDYVGYVAPKFMLRRRVRVKIFPAFVDSFPHIKKTSLELNLLQKRHQRRQRGHTAWGCGEARDIDARKRFRLHLMIEQNDEWSLQRRYMQLEGLQSLCENQSVRLSAVIN